MLDIGDKMVNRVDMYLFSYNLEQLLKVLVEDDFQLLVFCGGCFG